jgi:hypothetical protein
MCMTRNVCVCARTMTYHGLSHEVGLQPLSDTFQVQVDTHQSQLPPPLDQLVWLHYQPLWTRQHGSNC